MDQHIPRKGKLLPTGKWETAIDVSYQISQQPVEAMDAERLIVKQKSVVHSIAADGGRHIPLGDFDLVVGDELVRLKHVASDPEWLVLSSNVAAIFS